VGEGEGWRWLGEGAASIIVVIDRKQSEWRASRSDRIVNRNSWIVFSMSATGANQTCMLTVMLNGSRDEDTIKKRISCWLKNATNRTASSLSRDTHPSVYHLQPRP
jgi:hypothetical protein